MMKRIAVLVVAGLTMPCFAQNKIAAKPSTPVPEIAQTQVSPLCKSAEQLIDVSLKAVAFWDAMEDWENSAPRVTNYKLAQVAERVNLQSQLTHMQMLGCPAFQAPLDSRSFRKAAQTCVNAKSSEERQTNCERSKWARE